MHRLGALVFLSGTIAAAQQSAPSTDQIPAPATRETVIVTATYSPTALEECDRAVDTVEIERNRILFGSWADALRVDSSIDLRERSPGTQGDLSIRGSSFGQTLVLVDGIRVNDAQSGHHNLDLPIPFESVQNIEVLHGSGSTLYGSDAVGGAVNFITANPKATEFRLSAGAGNFGTNVESGSASLLRNHWSEQLGFTRDFSSGFAPDRDYRNFAAASESRGRTHLGLSALLLGLSDRPFGADQFYGTFNSWERTKGWFAAASQQVGANTQLVLGYRRHSDEFVLLRDKPEVYENNHITESWQGAVREHTKLTQNAGLYYGAEFYRDSIESNNLGQHARTRGAAYLDLDTRALRRFSFSIGSREEIFSQGSSDFSPTVSAGYWLSSHLRLRASVAHAFRVPSYTDLYYSDPANVGNPSLRPERAWGYEAGLEWDRGERFGGNITLFLRREHDVIDYVRLSSAGPWRAENIDQLQFTGIEFLTHFKLTASQQLGLGYTGLYGERLGPTGIQAKYVFDYPANQASLNWSGSLPARMSLRARAGVTQRYRSEPYPLVEFSAARQFGPIEPYVQITNATNTGYEEIQGVRMPGRAYLIGMQMKWTMYPHRVASKRGEASRNSVITE